MAIRLKVMGVEVICDTADEALALATKMTLAQQKSRTEPTVPKPLAPVLESKTLFDDQRALDRHKQPKPGFDSTAATKTFLTILERQWPEGASGERLSEALGLNHPKALGGRLALINQRIKEFGFAPENVYSVKRDTTTEGKRMWFSGKDFDELMKQVR